MLRTRITDFFGIARPIVQGGLMWIARSELASAVGNAGGIGFMTALTFPEPEGLRAEIRKCREMTEAKQIIQEKFSQVIIDNPHVS